MSEHKSLRVPVMSPQEFERLQKREAEESMLVKRIVKEIKEQLPTVDLSPLMERLDNLEARFAGFEKKVALALEMKLDLDNRELELIDLLAERMRNKK